MPSRAVSLVGAGAVVGVVGAAAEVVPADVSIGSPMAGAAVVVVVGNTRSTIVGAAAGVEPAAEMASL